MKILCVGLLLLGVFLSGYLLFRGFELTHPSNQQGTDVCSVVFEAGCDDTLRSGFARQLGIPLAGWGVVYYGFLATLMALGWSLGPLFEREANHVAFVASFCAALASAALLAAMLFGIAPFCPLCFAVQMVNFSLVGVLAKLTGSRLLQIPRSTIQMMRSLFLSDGVASPEGVWKLVGLLVAPLVGLILYQWVVIQESSITTSMEARSLRAIMAFDESQEFDISIASDDPQRTPAEASIEMVIFSDLRCPSCRRFATTVQQLAREFEEDMQFVFKHFPLDSVCNSAIDKRLHPGACQAAWRAEAAHRQGMFWEFHDKVFDDFYGREDEALADMANSSPFDLQQFAADLDEPSVKNKVSHDIRQGIRLGVDSTPAIFIDGRRVRETQHDVLRSLIMHRIRLRQK